jgi:hypothetical protein
VAWFQQEVNNRLVLIEERITHIEKLLERKIEHRFQEFISRTENRLEEMHEKITRDTYLKIETEIQRHVVVIREQIYLLVMGQLQKNIDNWIQAQVRSQLQVVVQDLDINQVRSELNVAFHKWMEVEQQLRVDMRGELAILEQWSVAEFMKIKGCLTDRHVMVEMVEQFSHELRVRLDTIECVTALTVPPVRAGGLLRSNG